MSYALTNSVRLTEWRTRHTPAVPMGLSGNADKVVLLRLAGLKYKHPVALDRDEASKGFRSIARARVGACTCCGFANDPFAPS